MQPICHCMRNAFLPVSQGAQLRHLGLSLA